MNRTLVATTQVLRLSTAAIPNKGGTIMNSTTPEVFHTPRAPIRASRRLPGLGSALLGLLVLLGGLEPAIAQDPDDSDESIRAFVSAGAGFGSHFTPHASLSVSHPTGDYILRGAAGYGADLGGSGPWGGPREVTEVSVMYGRRMEWNRAWIRGSLGLGYVDWSQPDPVSPGEEPATSTLGLAAQAGIVWVPVSSFGIGLTGVGDFNDLESLAAVTLSVHVGRLR